MADASQLDPSHAVWLHRLPHYLYLGDLARGRRVLEVGCGVGYGARFLAQTGAAEVVGVDIDSRAIEVARVRHRLTNLEFRCEDLASLEIEDQSFECVFVPAGIDVMRRPSRLAELRRVLAPEGRLVLCGRSADRPAADRGASVYEFYERLGPMFAPIRMVAQTPLCAISMVEYGEEGAPDPELVLDTTLLGLGGEEEEVTDYVAICGGPEDAALRGMVLVQLPQRAGVEAAAGALAMRAAAEPPRLSPEDEEESVQTVPGPWAEAPFRTPEPTEPEGGRAEDATPATQLVSEALAVHERDMKSLERVIEERDAYIDELRDDLSQAREALDRADERERLADERIGDLEQELIRLRQRAAAAEGELLRYRGSDEARPPGTGEGDTGPAPARPVELDERRPRARRTGEGVPAKVHLLGERLRSVESALAAERDLLAEVEKGLADLAGDAVEEAAAQAPSAWAAQREEKLRELSSELGIKDAEITILHVGVSALQDRVKELTERLSAYEG